MCRVESASRSSETPTRGRRRGCRRRRRVRRRRGPPTRSPTTWRASRRTSASGRSAARRRGTAPRPTVRRRGRGESGDPAPDAFAGGAVCFEKPTMVSRSRRIFAPARSLKRALRQPGTRTAGGVTVRTSTTGRCGSPRPLGRGQAEPRAAPLSVNLDDGERRDSARKQECAHKRKRRRPGGRRPSRRGFRRP